MAGRAHEKGSRQAEMPQDGQGAPAKRPEVRYCAVCGADANVHGLAVERFGEAFCSEGHAEEFAREVRAARVQAAAAAPVSRPSTTEIGQREGPAEGTPGRGDWKHYLKMGACCGLPILGLLILAGGGGALLGAAGAILPVLLLLACPLGMYFMMRGKTAHHENPKDKGEEK